MEWTSNGSESNLEGGLVRGGRSGGPVGSANGRELYYHRPKERTVENELLVVFAVDIGTDPEFRAGTPRKLFEGRYIATTPVRNWDVTSDGQRFVMMREDERPQVEPET